MRIELRQIDSDRLITTISIDEPGNVPHPGRWLVLGDRSYLVLQRHHRYQLRRGRYELVTVALQVKPQRQPADSLWWEGRWVIGDPQCRFNARSPLLRCAVLPEGPCDHCSHRSPR